MCSAHRDKAEIKCMGSIGGKTLTKPKSLFIIVEDISKGYPN